ncbi:unnamed protein product, partial [Ectocarpus sp. 13 AM-2016]
QRIASHACCWCVYTYVTVYIVELCTVAVHCSCAAVRCCVCCVMRGVQLWGFREVFIELSYRYRVIEISKQANFFDGRYRYNHSIRYIEKIDTISNTSSIPGC